MAVTPSELENAWWRWVDENCPKKSRTGRGKWMRENELSYGGTVWSRYRESMRSNSGKTHYTTSLSFHAADGRTVAEKMDLPLNRRNDPDRNWGLHE